jgi:PAS domain-containing protein
MFPFLLAIDLPLGTIALTELVKLVFSFTVGALLIYARTAIFKCFTDMKKFIIAAKQGVELLSSDGFKELPIVIKNLDDRVKGLEKFVGPNGGKSIIDGINSLKETAKELQEAIAAVSARDREIIDATGILMWRSDESGACIWASKALQQLVGYSFNEGFKGYQWENLFFPEDFPVISRRWDEALSIETKSPYNESEIILSMKTRYKHAITGRAIPVHFKASRLPDGTISGIVTDLSSVATGPFDIVR